MYLQEQRPISTGTRLGAMLLDHFFMCIIAMAFFVPGMIAGFASAFNISHEQENTGFMQGPFQYIGLLGFSLYFCKDIINGRSIAKRILNLQVVDNKSGEVASPLQCFVRDLFCVLWMVEVIVAMTNTSRRIGDKVAGTRLVYYDRSLEQPSASTVRWLIPVALSYGIIILLMSLLPSGSMAATGYSRHSYNPRESKALEQYMTDSLGQYLTTDIRVYDTINEQPVKYISIILKLKENYLAEEGSASWLQSRTSSLLYAYIPAGSFTGQIKYVYKASGQFQSSSSTIGTYSPPSQK